MALNTINIHIYIYLKMTVYNHAIIIYIRLTLHIYPCPLCWIYGIKTGCRGVCCHNARGCVRTRSQIPRPLALGIWRAVRTSPNLLWQQTLKDRFNHDYNITLSISPRECYYSRLKYEHGDRSESHFASYSHSYATLPHTFNIGVFKTTKRNCATNNIFTIDLQT